jgi:uncharacterized protein
MKQKAITLLVFLLLVSSAAVLMLRINQPVPGSGLAGIWFYSGLAMVLVSMFYIEPYYAAPRNVLSHAITVVLVLLSVHVSMREHALGYFWWRVLLIYASAMIVLSLGAMVLPDPKRGPMYGFNRFGDSLKGIAVALGSGKVVYSFVFLLFLPLLHDLRDPWVIATLSLWWLVIISDPGRRLAAALEKARHTSQTLGEIFSVQSSQVFVARAHPDGPDVEPLDPVEFSYAVDDSSAESRVGLVVDCYHLNDEKWMKILQAGNSKTASSVKGNEVRRLYGSEAESLAGLRNRLVGLVCEDSDIRIIRFEVISGAPSVQEGDLVEIAIRSQRVFYQVVNGTTDAERLEEKNESGFVRGDALQLGVWNDELQPFDAFGWVPNMNAPVLKAEGNMKLDEISSPEYRLGNIPGTKIPVAINLDTARSHHLAVLGVTGAGKSFITLELLRELIKGTKVVCVDFTGKYIQELASLEPRRLIDKEGLEQVEVTMAKKADSGKEEALKKRGQIADKLQTYVKDFMNDARNLAIFELPDLSNMTFILEFTQMFLDAIFRYAREMPGTKVCLVIEEAHTVIFPRPQALAISATTAAIRRW